MVFVFLFLWWRNCWCDFQLHEAVWFGTVLTLCVLSEKSRSYILVEWITMPCVFIHWHTFLTQVFHQVLQQHYFSSRPTIWENSRILNVYKSVNVFKVTACFIWSPITINCACMTKCIMEKIILESDQFFIGWDNSQVLPLPFFYWETPFNRNDCAFNDIYI